MYSFKEAGIATADIIEKTGVHPIATPDDWWTTLLGTGYRGTLEQLDSPTLARVREANHRFIEVAGIKEIAANVIYAVAIKPA